MIYTRFGTPVKLTSCEVSTEQGQHGPFTQFWVTAEQSGPSIGTKNDETPLIGRPILDGKQFGAFELRADGGWGEILDACNALRPEPEFSDAFA